jgi:hypothetical protein
VTRKIVLLNVLLLALAAWLGWLVRKNWFDSEGRQRRFLSQQVKAPAVPQIAPPAPVEKPVAANYLEVDQKTLFSKDRNSAVAVEAPPPPPPPKPIPPLPVYHGQMNLGDPVALLSTGKNDQKSYHKGDTIGEFKLIAFNHDTITLEFDGKNLEHPLSDLVPKENQQAQAQAAPPPAAPAPASSAATSLSGGQQQKNLSDSEKLGTDMGGFKACVAGDNSPNGTVLNGWVKRMTQGLMGQSCHWEPVK